MTFGPNCPNFADPKVLQEWTEYEERCNLNIRIFALEELLNEFIEALGPEGPMLRDVAAKAKAFMDKKK